MIVELKNNCGLDLKLDTEKTELIFDETMHFSELKVRTLDDMREVILDPKINAPRELYYMYRDVYAFSDKALLEKNKLRYDVTIIKSDVLGREFMKTAGHYHPGSFGELYEVVFGRALCMLQRPNTQDYRILEEVVLVEAVAGQKIVIPPGFGHILINPGPTCLVTSNWVSSEFSSEYDLYKKAKGAAYFVTGSLGEPEFIPNPSFSKMPKIRFVKPAKVISRFGLEENRPIYPIIRQDPRKLLFLNSPLDFAYDEVFVGA